MSSCRIRVDQIQEGLYEVRRRERGDCYGYPLKNDTYEVPEHELENFVRKLKTEPSDGIKPYTDISVVATPELQWRLSR